MTNLLPTITMRNLGTAMLKGSNELFEIIGLIWRHKLFTIAGIELSFGNVLIALTLLLFASRLSRLVSSVINRRLIEPFVHDRASRNTYQTFIFYGALVLVIALSLTIAGIPLTVFTVIGGALAIGVGFGSQNIVNNFISGIILLIEKPIRVGDIVDVDTISGSVQTIGTRSTKIRNGDGKVFVVPNSLLLEKPVLNWSYDSTVLRATVSFGAAYGSDVKQIENICMDIMLNTEGVKQSPLPVVFFDNFGSSTLDFQLSFWCDLKEVTSLSHVKSEVRFKLNERFKAHKVVLAFPQVDMNLKLNRALEVKLQS